jgi:hypothetical protein
VDRKTIRKYLAAERPPVYSLCRPRPTKLAPYRSVFGPALGAGVSHASQLYQKLVRRVYRGSESQVRAECSLGESPRGRRHRLRHRHPGLARSGRRTGWRRTSSCARQSFTAIAYWPGAIS